MDFTRDLNNLYQKAQRWQEEVAAFDSNETELTAEDVARLKCGIEELKKTLVMLKAEAQRLQAL